MTELTSAERDYVVGILQVLDDLKQFLCSAACDVDAVTPREFYGHVARAKSILGNLNLGVSFAGCLMAKQYLGAKFSMLPFDAAEKPQGAPGLDIDVSTLDGERVIAEIKTTYPYKIDDLGSAQKTEFRKDFEKLKNTLAARKFFFVTEQRTFDVVKKRYSREIPGVTVVLLTTGEECLA